MQLQLRQWCGDGQELTDCSKFTQVTVDKTKSEMGRWVLGVGTGAGRPRPGSRYSLSQLSTCTCFAEKPYSSAIWWNLFKASSLCSRPRPVRTGCL